MSRARSVMPGAPPAPLRVSADCPGRGSPQRSNRRAWTAFPVGVTGDTRTNVSVIADNGQAFEVNGEGNPIDAEAVTRIRRALLENLLPGDTIALCGSFPRFRDGSPASFWTELAALARQTETALVLDTGGAFLREIFRDHLPAPSLIKPNFAVPEKRCRSTPGARYARGILRACGVVSARVPGRSRKDGGIVYARRARCGLRGRLRFPLRCDGAGALSESGERGGGHVSRRISDAARVRLGDCGIDGCCRRLCRCCGARRDVTDGTCPVALFI